MNFLRECASRLEEGCPAEVILREMEERYTTPRCMNVKTCVVRGLCRPTPEYEDAIRRWREGDTTVVVPPKWNDNVNRLRIPRSDMKLCKRLGARSVIQKNSKCITVDGHQLLDHSRRILHDSEGSSLSDLALSLMLVTGRRTCETLNGSSRFEEGPDPHASQFVGLAKQRHGDGKSMLVPLLLPFPLVQRGLTRMRFLQKERVLSNRDTSIRYQSQLRKHLLSDPVWSQCGRVHSLRGIYTCMALRLFDWPDGLSDAYISMCILGHKSILDSLVYTAYRLSPGFEEREPPRGKGHLTLYSSVCEGEEEEGRGG